MISILIVTTIIDINIEIDIDINISIIPMLTVDGEISDIQTFLSSQLLTIFAGSLWKCQPEMHERELFKMKILFSL